MEHKIQGRPSDYDPTYHDEIAFNYTLLGADDKALATFFNIDTETLNNWKEKHPTFLGSIKEGKEYADARVAHSLFSRATGYKHKDVDIRAVNGEIVMTDTVKHYPPDPTSMIFWLKNRQPGLWRDKQELDTKNTNINVDVTPDDEEAVRIKNAILKDI